VIVLMLIAEAAVNAIFSTWATVLDARHTTALARAFGATSREVAAGLSASSRTSRETERPIAALGPAPSIMPVIRPSTASTFAAVKSKGTMSSDVLTGDETVRPLDRCAWDPVPPRRGGSGVLCELAWCDRPGNGAAKVAGPSQDAASMSAAGGGLW
jgi:hypothetical protein